MVVICMCYDLPIAVQDEVLIKAEIENLARSVKSQGLLSVVQGTEALNVNCTKSNEYEKLEKGDENLPPKSNENLPPKSNENLPENLPENRVDVERHTMEIKKELLRSHGSVVELSP